MADEGISIVKRGQGTQGTQGGAAAQPQLSVGDRYRSILGEASPPAGTTAPMPSDRGAAYRAATAERLRQGRAPETERTAADYDRMSWGEYVPIVASNVGPSTVSALSGMANAVMNPIETAKTVGNLGVGLGSKAIDAAGNAVGYGPVLDQEGKAEREQIADALIENYKGRYGGGEEGEFWKNLAEDPMSYATDIASVASLGAGSATKLGLIDKAGKVAKAARFAENLDPVQAAMNLSGKAATAAGTIPPYMLMGLQSAASGVPLKALRTAREVGLSGDPAKVSAFMTALKGNPNFTGDVAAALEKAIDDMEQQASNAYMTSQATAFARSQPVDMTVPTMARDTLHDMLNPNTVLRAPVTYKASDIQAAKDALFQIDSALTHPSNAGRTIQELDVIKKSIDRLTKQIEDPSLKGRVNDIAASLVNAMSDTDPAYGDMMRGWQEYKHQLNNVRKDFGSSNMSDAARARKVTRAFNSKYGDQMFSRLEGTPSGENLRYSIAGDTMSEWKGDSINNVIAGLGGPAAAALYFGVHPATVPAAAASLALASPKAAGYSQYALGRTQRAVNDRVGGLADALLPPIVTNIGSQVGSALPPEEERVGRKAGGRVGLNHDKLADQLVGAAERAKKGISKGTEALLDMPDDHVAHALEVANRSI